MSISHDQALQIVVEIELRKFSDDDLLLELRRRGRFARVETSHTIEGWRLAFGSAPPREYILKSLFKELGVVISERVIPGQVKIPGMKEEKGFFTDRPRYSGHQDLRYTIPLNFVVDK